ncbi:uncharacterized protein F4812DRAFT_324874 [Daldinia caldariorum]|uniref:uncharacterized protein n=1 Tax=Daldinia caldariorum TaxID=326644 RepID=UPI0020083D9D|nr:uncharacterized protein F4812DRAFT_324874 [Daldinia caldariorum]KAI1469298.1 hypothetical protein F4812DRAFT_324874 [Daldinia caldariorum]
MAESSPLKATPKRKRDDVLNERRVVDSSLNTYSLPRTTFSFQPPLLKPVETSRNDDPEDGNSSPRSKVAQKFQELALGSGGGVIRNDRVDGSVLKGTRTETGSDEASPQFAIDSPRFSPELTIFDFDGGIKGSTSIEDMQLDDDDTASRKRIKLANLTEHPNASKVGPEGEAYVTDPNPPGPPHSPRFTLQTAVDPAILRTAKTEGSGRLQKSYPSINRLSESKSRVRKRSGTPPLAKRKTTEASAEEEHTIIDPVRAALTWHEDEITIYDPEDKDDDGTGINGIGFRPTPALAYARAQKRRQQLAEYRKREESEARAKRSQRRRQRVGNAVELERKHPLARVRFSDAEPTTVVTT